MMIRLFIFATLLFWLIVSAFWLSSIWHTDRRTEALDNKPGITAATQPYSLAILASHKQADDCWMAIDGVVYNFTDYLPQHPAATDVMLNWCGREATQAFHSKNRGRPHSAYAIQLLAQYRAGVLEKN